MTNFLRTEIEDIAMTITSENYPVIFKAFQQIDLANGAINRLEPACTSYTVPREWLSRLSNSEAALAALSESELDTFCAGDADEAQALLDGRPAVLHSAHQLLNAYFNGWEEA